MKRRPRPENSYCLFVSHHQCVFHPLSTFLTVLLESWTLQQSFSQSVVDSHICFRINYLHSPISSSRSGFSSFLLISLSLSWSIEADSHDNFSSHKFTSFYGFSHIFDRSTSCHLTGCIFPCMYTFLIIIFLEHNIKFVQSIASLNYRSFVFTFRILSRWMSGLAIEELFVFSEWTYTHWRASYSAVVMLLERCWIWEYVINIKELSFISVERRIDLTTVHDSILNRRTWLPSMILTWRYGSVFDLTIHNFINYLSQNRI